jgi:hypothetical protein
MIFLVGNHAHVGKSKLEIESVVGIWKKTDEKLACWIPRFIKIIFANPAPIKMIFHLIAN